MLICRMEKSSLLKTMRSALEAVYGRRLRGVLLYGSEARGEPRTDSDIDVLVLLDRVADYGEDIWLCLEALYPVALKLGRRISPKPVDARQYDTLDCPLYRQVHREGIAA
jgi:predicted nucleotidyltransferase